MKEPLHLPCVKVDLDHGPLTEIATSLPELPFIVYRPNSLRFDFVYSLVLDFCAKS